MTAKLRWSALAGLVGWLLTTALLWPPELARCADAPADAKGSAPTTPPAKPPESTNDAAIAPNARLSQEEQRIAQKYAHLEEVLLRMAELSAGTDPRRTALLKKAVEQSREQLIAVRFDKVVEFLDKGQFSRAIENQNDLDRDLQSLLELLLSENRSKHIESERARIREYVKRLTRLIKQEKDIQGRTAGGDDANRLAKEQGQLAEKTGGLAKDVKQHEEDASGNANKKEADRGNAPPSPKEDSPSKPDGGSPPRPANESPDGSPQVPESKKPDETDEADKAKQDSQNPARQRLEAAQNRMKEAEAKLKEAERKGAGEKQEEAIRELEQAKSQLEEILRQLREEEIERTLVMLEARFRAMLAMQQEVYEGTVRLDKVPEAERTHNHEIESSRLSGKESQIVVEIDKALLLLHEDGSAVAIPEAAEQLRDDMQQVVQLLAQAKVARVTQNIEEDIITALQEMIDALKKAIKDQEKAGRAGKKSAASAQQSPPLVDLLAELKMIRALQIRVNARTEKFSKMITGEQAENAELIEALKHLAEREERIHRVTRDLQTGKDQ